jgi:quercetin dioxygenase-like cupin family protein
MARVFAKAELPHYVSTRDTRERLDVVTDDVPVGARTLRADRIVYEPGDTAAAHYHTGCAHLFYVLRGRGVACHGERRDRVGPGSVVVVEPGEIHWFENDTEDEFAFVEYWSPPPAETVWIHAGDACTWGRVPEATEAAS